MSSTVASMQSAMKTKTAPSRLPATVQESKAARRRFACGEDVEVRRRFPQIPGKKQLVIYARAKIVSISIGTDSYLVQYPAAAGSIPSRTARVSAWDVRAACPVPPPPQAADVARPASSKKTPPSESAGDCRNKKPRRTGKGIPMDALLQFFAEHEKEEEAKKQKAELLAPKLGPKTRTIKMIDRPCPAFVSVQ